MLRFSHILTTAALMAALAGPASAVPAEQFDPTDHKTGASEQAGDTGFRTSYEPAAATGTGGQDLRSPDAVDAAQHRGMYEPKPEGYALNRDYGSPDAADTARDLPQKPEGFALNRDYGSPDAVDAARDLPPVQIPVLEPRDAGSFDWGDAGIGAAGMLGAFSIAAASALLLTGRRRRQRLA